MHTKLRVPFISTYKHIVDDHEDHPYDDDEQVNYNDNEWDQNYDHDHDHDHSHEHNDQTDLKVQNNGLTWDVL